MAEQRSISIQNAGGKSSIRHNNRDKELGNVDTERTEFNRTLVKENLREVYEREFGSALEKYNAKQKRDDRKIKDYFSHVRKSDSLELQREEIIQIGDKDNYFLPFGQEWEETADMYEEFFEQWKEQNPNLVPYNVVIHMDEASPHMHINYVPVAEGYKRGLEKQPSFSKALENQGFTGNKKQRFSDWRNQQLESIEEIMKEHSLERKEVGKNNFKNHYEYQEAMQEVENLYSERDKLQERLNMLSGSINSLERKNEVLESNNQQLENKAKELESKFVRNGDMLTKQKKSWESHKEWKAEYDKFENTTAFIKRIPIEPVIERTLTGRREVEDKVIVSKKDWSKVSKSLNAAYEANHVAKRELKEEKAAYHDLKKRHVSTQNAAVHWREQFEDLKEKVDGIYKPALKQLEKFKDWAINVFEKGGNDEKTIMTAFNGHVEREEKEERQRQELEEQRKRQAYRDRDFGPSL